MLLPHFLRGGNANWPVRGIKQNLALQSHLASPGDKLTQMTEKVSVASLGVLPPFLAPAPIPHTPAPKQALVLEAHEAAPAPCLQQCQNLGQTLVTKLLQNTKEPSFEEHLGLGDVPGVNPNCLHGSCPL